MTVCILNSIYLIVNTICDKFSISNDKFKLKLLPQFSSSPAKYSSQLDEIPVQILLHDIETIKNKWMPYIYFDRKMFHLDIFKIFPDIPNLNTFSFADVINGNDGINECIKSLEDERSPGYKWGVVSGEIIEVDDSIELNTDIKLYEYMYYSLYWALVNYYRALNGSLIYESEKNVVSIIELLPVENKYKDNPCLRFLLNKHYLSLSSCDLKNCKLFAIGFLRELIKK